MKAVLALHRLYCNNLGLLHYQVDLMCSKISPQACISLIPPIYIYVDED